MNVEGDRVIQWMANEIVERNILKGDSWELDY